jgi:hypothetical protein
MKTLMILKITIMNPGNLHKAAFVLRVENVIYYSYYYINNTRTFT